jgi:hypothetical protein
LKINDPVAGIRSDTMSLVTASASQVMLRVGANSVTLLPELNKTVRAVLQSVETEGKGPVVGFPQRKPRCANPKSGLKTARPLKTPKNRAIRDNFLYYRVKTRYKHNGGYVLSPGPAVPRGVHFDENHTGER